MRKIKLIYVFLLTVSIITIFGVTSKGKTVKAADGIIKHATSAVAMEVETGKILYEYNPNVKLAPASMTKVMTMKLILDALKSKRITYDQLLTTSNNAHSMGGTQIYLAPGEKMKVEDLFKAMVIASANDAAVVLAEAISGTESNFAQMMNTEAKSLGLINTNFINSTGLPADNHYTTSSDMAHIARNLLLNYEEEIIPLTSTYEDYVRQDSEKPFWLVNTNKLIKHVEGIDGLKTGWTEQAGYCLTCTKKQDGMRIITVVMNAPSVADRTADTLALMNYVFSNFHKQVLIEKGTVVQTDEDIFLDPSTFSIVTKTNASYVKEIGKEMGTIRHEIVIDQNAIRGLQLTKIGFMNTYINDELVSTVDLEIKEKVKRSSLWEMIKEILEKIF